jgi:two-component system LytT family response regulator
MTQPTELRVLVVDDEAPARRKLLRLLREEPGVEIVGEVDSGHLAVAAIMSLRPDLVFLDVQMPGLDGFGVLSAVSGRWTPEIVFVTAHDRFALRAFEVHALDYLLKPFSQQRFREMLQRAQKHQTSKSDRTDVRLVALVEELRQQQSYTERLFVSGTDRAFFVPVRTITWIESDRNYVILHCRGKSHTVRAALGSILKNLDPRQFVRINRKAVVRFDAIVELLPWFHGEYKLRLEDGCELRWSRRYAPQNLQAFHLR